MRLNLSYNIYSAKWWRFNQDNYNYFVCGWADYKGNILSEATFIDVIKEIDFEKFDDFKKFASNLNGNFTIIVATSKKTYIAADRMRSYPIVYFFYQGQLIITDDIMKFQNEYKLDFEIDEVSCEQYLRSNYIIGPYNIYKEVFSVQSGECIEIKHADRLINRKQYFQWTPNMQNDEFKRDYSKEAKLQDDIFLSVFTRMIESAPHVNNWIIPLSGGYDSRTIINYLYKLGVKNVICFTYGIKKNLESEISKQVAEALGYQWYFVDYNTWIQKMNSDNIIGEYLKFGFNGNSVSHLQDFPAVYALMKMNILANNDVFVPGHALEVIAGSHLKLKMRKCNSIEKVIPVIGNHFSGFGYYTKKRKAVKQRTKSILENYNIRTEQMAECFDWQERQTKFIANSIKCYEYFGFEWRIPEWDAELMSYWEKIGFNYRFDRDMFKEIFKNVLVVEPIQNIAFANDILKKKSKTLQTIFINHIPFAIKKIIKKKGWYTSKYYLDEGSHLIYRNNGESINDYINSYCAPFCVKRYLGPYYRKQKISDFEVNTVTTLINIRNSIISK